MHELDLVLRRDPERLRVGRIVVANGTGSLADDLLPNRCAWELDGAAGQRLARVTCAIVRFSRSRRPSGRDSGGKAIERGRSTSRTERT
jgi:hypothetical protein